MIYYKTGKLSKKEENKIKFILSEIPNKFNDFYLTKNNKRIFFNNDLYLLFKCIKKGDKIVYSSEEGILLLTGFSDKANRKYLKILTKSNHSLERLLQVFFWNYNKELWVKIKKYNPALRLLQDKSMKILVNNKLVPKFKFFGLRGNEILLYKEEVRRQINVKHNENFNKD